MGWTPDKNGVLKILANTPAYAGASTESNVVETLHKGQSFKAYGISPTDEGVFYIIGGGKYVYQSNRVSFVDSDQVGVDTFSMQNIINIGVLFVLVKGALGAFKWVGKKV